MTANIWVWAYFSGNIYAFWMWSEHTCWKGRGAIGNYNITLLSLGPMQLGCVPFILISSDFNFICRLIPEHSSSNMIWAITSRLGMCAAYYDLRRWKKSVVRRLMKLTTLPARLMHGPVPKLKQTAWGYSIWTITFQWTYLSSQTAQKTFSVLEELHRCIFSLLPAVVRSTDTRRH